MGTSLGVLLTADTISLSELSDKVIAIDALNSIYAFLSIIRMSDGTPLTDKQGRITSHLSGLFNRNIRLLNNEVHPVYVFDGEPPALKSDEIRRRQDIRATANEAWKQAKAEGRIDDAQKAAKESAMITTEIIEESKKLLHAMGIPIVQAPSEGEATAAQLTRDGTAWAAASQDNDLLLYGCPRMIRNLVGRRTPRSRSDKIIPLEIIDLRKNLELLGMTRNQLIDLAILIGTDYNDKIPRIGPKTAMKLIQKYGSLEMIESSERVDITFPYHEIRDIFLHPPLAKKDTPRFGDIDAERVKRILCDDHDFDVRRVETAIQKYLESNNKPHEKAKQSSLTDFL